MNSTNDAAWLLDVNALIALIAPGHVHHETMHRWFAQKSSEGWATCPIAENGAIRIMSLPNFAAGPYKPIEVIEVLTALWRTHAEYHHFWADDVSLSDETLFYADRITSHKHVTDAYLLGLAAKHGAKLVSFDRNLPWQAIRKGTARLMESPLLQ